MPAGIFGLVSSSISLREAVERRHAERHAHPLHRPVQVDRDRHVEALGLLEQQRGPAARRLRHAVGDGADLEVRADRLLDPRQLAILVEGIDEGVQILEHRCFGGYDRALIHGFVLDCKLQLRPSPSCQQSPGPARARGGRLRRSRAACASGGPPGRNRSARASAALRGSPAACPPGSRGRSPSRRIRR